MNKTIMLFEGFLLLAIVPGCKVLTSINPPQPRQEILCKAWVSNPAVQTQGQAQDNPNAESPKNVRQHAN